MKDELQYYFAGYGWAFASTRYPSSTLALDFLAFTSDIKGFALAKIPPFAFGASNCGKLPNMDLEETSFKLCETEPVAGCLFWHEKSSGDDVDYVYGISSMSSCNRQ